MREIDYPSLILPLATHFWGEPNKGLTTKFGARFGSQGSKAIVFAKGTWFDHEQQHGGGVVELVMREAGVETEAEAHRWLEDQGFIAKDPATARQPRQVTEDRSGRPSGQPEPQASPEQAEAKSQRKGRYTVVETYDYESGDGELLYQVARIQWKLPDGSWELNPKTGKPEKTFRQRRKSGLPDGSWVWGLSAGEYMRKRPGDDFRRFDKDLWAEWGGGERLTMTTDIPHGLFRLPQIERAIERGDTVYVVEGEKAARAGEKLGLETTCNSGGANKFHDDLLRHFRGANVVILPDNDPQAMKKMRRKVMVDGEEVVEQWEEPAWHPDGRPVRPGIDHAEMVARKLRGIAASVKVLELPGIPLKGDIVEWIAAGGTAEQLYDLIVQLPDWKPRPPQGFGGRSMISLAGKPIEYDWLIKGLVERNGVFILAAEKQAGKSFVVMDMGMKIASGLQYGDRITRKGIVIHVACEDGKGVQMRAEGYRQANGLSPDTDIPYVVMTHGFTLMDDKVIDQFITTVKEWEEFYGLPVELIIIDTLSVATEGLNEIDGAEVGKVLARVNRLKDATHAAICLVHHMNASGGRVRGHTSIEANVSQVFEIRPLMTIPNNRRETPQPILDAQGRHIRQIVLTKNKNGLNNLKWRIVLEVVKLGFDADGDEITTCVCARPARAASGSESGEDTTKLVGDQKLVFDALVTAQADKGIDRPEGVSAPPQISKCVSQQDFVAAVRKVINFTAGEEEIEARNKELQAFLKRTTTALINAGYMGRDNDKRVVWHTGKSDRPRPRREEPPPEDTRPISVTEAPF